MQYLDVFKTPKHFLNSKFRGNTQQNPK